MAKELPKLTPQQQLKTDFVNRYLKKKLGLTYKFKSGVFTCPKCKLENPSAMFIEGSVKLHCINPECNYEAHVLDVVKMIENKPDLSNELVAKFLKDDYGIVMPTLNAEFYFNAYEKFGFDLVCIIANDKKPFNPDGGWQNEVHKDKEEWLKWYKAGMNIGIKTGKCSNITCVDFDDENIVPDIFKNFTTIVQKTRRGFHYIFEYESDLPNHNMRHNKDPQFKIPVEILNDGKQFVCAPSKVEGNERTWNFSDYNFVIPKMSDDIKKWLLERINDKNSQPPEPSELEKQIKQDIKDEKLVNSGELESPVEGSRNSTLIKFGGILRKQLNSTQVGYVLRLFNKNFLKSPLPEREIYAMLGSLDKYIHIEEKDLAMKIYDYLKYAEEATSQDIVIALEENKVDVDKAIAYLIRERYVARRGRTFHLLRKMRWRNDDYDVISGEVPFKVPYFDDVCHTNWGDMFILGGLPGTGKTTISMNILKRLIEQGIKPYYVCLETGSRFTKTASSLGISPSDYYRVVETDPTRILIEPNSVTILDWLLIKDKERTDSIMQHFSEQLVQTNSFLIILMQLKHEPAGQWFAPNMIDQFPAFAARYLYENPDSRETGYWQIDKIREPKQQNMNGRKIPCRYLFKEKKLMRIDELDEFKSTDSQDIVEI